MAAAGLLQEKVWTDKTKYDEAECAYYEHLSKARLTPLADEVAKARQRLIEVIDASKEPKCDISSVDTGAIKFLEKKVIELQNLVAGMQQHFAKMEARINTLEQRAGVGGLPVCSKGMGVCPAKMAAPAAPAKGAAAADDDDDVDLFGSDSEDDESANKVREERLAAYNDKKSKKVAIIAKSSVVLDIKPWEDTTDMEEMQEHVRAITMDGLLWGASKLVPLAYGIKKLQISCVVEDDKVSIDELQEKIEAIEDLVQSVDIAAFNKI